MTKVGKRDFMMHVSRYLKQVELSGEELLITHQNKPSLKIIPLKPKTIKELRGVIKKPVKRSEINKPVFPGFNQW